MVELINSIQTVIGYDFYADVAERIVYERKHRGITQGELSRIADVSTSLIARYESVSIRMRKPILEKIAKALNVDIDMLIGATYDDPDAGICTYTVRRKRDDEFSLFFRAKSPQEAFLDAYEWSRKAGVLWFECRDRAVITLRGIPVRKSHYAHLRKRDSDEDEIDRVVRA